MAHFLAEQLAITVSFYVIDGIIIGTILSGCFSFFVYG